MTELLFNTLVNLSIITGIIFMLALIVGMVKVIHEWFEEWLDDRREEHE